MIGPVLSSVALIAVAVMIATGNKPHTITCRRCGRSITAEHGHVLQWLMAHDCR